MKTIRECIEESPLLSSGDVDTALPQQWVNEVFDATGIYTPGHIVWFYGERSLFGRPVPITIVGWVALRLYPRGEH